MAYAILIVVLCLPALLSLVAIRQIAEGSPRPITVSVRPRTRRR
jgi:hypothetical protein